VQEIEEFFAWIARFSGSATWLQICYLQFQESQGSCHSNQTETKNKPKLQIIGSNKVIFAVLETRLMSPLQCFKLRSFFTLIEFKSRPYNRSALPCCLWWRSVQIQGFHNAPHVEKRKKYGKKEESFYFLRICCANMLVRYSIMAADLNEPEELSKVNPATHLRFVRTSKRFYDLWTWRCALGQTNMTSAKLPINRWIAYISHIIS